MAYACTQTYPLTRRNQFPHKQAGLLACGSMPHLSFPSDNLTVERNKAKLPTYSGGTALDLHQSSLFTSCRMGHEDLFAYAIVQLLLIIGETLGLSIEYDVDATQGLEG